MTLSVSNAVCVRENQVRVTFSSAVRFTGTREPGDGGDPSNYTVVDSVGAVYRATLVLQVSDAVVDLVLGDVLSSDATVSVSGVVSTLGDALGTAYAATIAAIPYKTPAVLDATAGGARDIASVNGVWVVDRGGDFATDVGLVQLRKRLFRRLTTPKNAISHLPGYGVDVAAYIKQLASSSARARLINEIELQFVQEPEVLSARALLVQVGNKGLWRLKVNVRTRLGATLRPEYDVGLQADRSFAEPTLINASSAAPWTPILAAPDFWLRADSGITEAGGPGTGVSQWADQSGKGDVGRNAVQATLARRPAYTASDPAFNNQASVSCTVLGGTQERWMATGAWTDTVSGNMTLAIVARRRNTSAFNRYLIDSRPGDAQQLAIYENDTGTSLFAYSTVGGNYTAYTGDATTRTALIVSAQTGSVAKIRVNSNTHNGFTAADPGAFSATGLSIGNYQGSGNYCDWDIAEVVLWRSQLSQQTINNLNAYFATRYNLTIAP